MRHNESHFVDENEVKYSYNELQRNSNYNDDFFRFPNEVLATFEQGPGNLTTVKWSNEIRRYSKKYTKVSLHYRCLCYKDEVINVELKILAIFMLFVLSSVLLCISFRDRLVKLFT